MTAVRLIVGKRYVAITSIGRPLRRTMSTAAAKVDGPSGSKDLQQLSLPDGRILAYAESGAASGMPVFYLHGWPSSRLEARGLDKIASKRNLRIISPDRPGFGYSTPQPKRRIVDHAQDIQCLADHLRLDRFAVVGGSGGGPYALACAKVVPSARLTAVGLLASAPPWQAGKGDLPYVSRMVAFAARTFPAALTGVLSAVVKASLWFTRSRVGQTMVDGIIKAGALKTGETVTASELPKKRENLERLLFEGFRQGLRPTVDESCLLTSDWGIDFKTVDAETILIWHAEKDWQAPISMIRYLADQLPDARLKVFTGDNHYSIGFRLDGIMEELASKIAAEP